MENRSRFGPVIQRYCLCVVYYLWAFSYSEIEREARISNLNSSLRKDLLGAVKPFIEEISTALDDPGCSDAERAMLEDFAATYEAVLEYDQIAFERVEPTWDLYQIPHDNRLNRSLFGVLRGLDLFHLEVRAEAARVLLPAWSKLLAIEKRRALPHPLRQLLQENEELVGRFEAECRDQPPEEPESVAPLPEVPGSLPSVHDLLLSRQHGQNPGLENLVLEQLQRRESRPRPQESTGLVIDLVGDGSPPSSAPPRPEDTSPPVAPRSPGLSGSAPPSPLPSSSPPRGPGATSAPPRPDPGPDPELAALVPGKSDDGSLSIPLNLSGLRPLPSAEEAGKAMLESQPEEPLPSVESLPAVHGEENPWQEISEAPHVLLEETEALNPPRAQPPTGPDLFPQVGSSSGEDEEEGVITAQGDQLRLSNTAPRPSGEVAAKKHQELAELFDD